MVKDDLTHEDAQVFTKNVLNFMREKLSDYQEEYGDLYNLEATPAESTSYRLAKKDKEKYPDIITASNDDTPYYTNSSHLPVGFTSDIFEALDIQDELQTLYTSGTVFHAFLGERLDGWKSAANLVRKIAENYKLPYYTLSPTYSVCKIMDILLVKCINVQSVDVIRKFIVGLLDIIDQLETGMMVNQKNFLCVRYMI